MAYVPSLITIVVIYYWLFRLSFSLYKKSPIGFAALVVFLSPFAIALTQVRNLLELMWVLLLTPAYSVIVTSLLFTNWIIRYYCLAFATLALLKFTIQRRNARHAHMGKSVNYQAFWNQHATKAVQIKKTKSKIYKLSGKWKFQPIETVKTHRNRHRGNCSSSRHGNHACKQHASQKSNLQRGHAIRSLRQNIPESIQRKNLHVRQLRHRLQKQRPQSRIRVRIRNHILPRQQQPRTKLLQHHRPRTNLHRTPIKRNSNINHRKTILGHNKTCTAK